MMSRNVVAVVDGLHHFQRDVRIVLVEHLFEDKPAITRVSAPGIFDDQRLRRYFAIAVKKGLAIVGVPCRDLTLHKTLDAFSIQLRRHFDCTPFIVFCSYTMIQTINLPANAEAAGEPGARPRPASRGGVALCRRSAFSRFRNPPPRRRIAPP